jgi:(1->4)-alpha-D-glucan 1-alpha-D-glucosylmutase
MERALEPGGAVIPPRATYRLQLRKNFGFADAARIAPYLARLGISHVYLSPVFKARPGSTHGYDITDHSELNPELGTEADYARMIMEFRREGLKTILDIVPNHMGVGGADNPLWLDVLEWGPESRYAGWFDIDWLAGGGKLLAPVLGEQYGEALRSGKLTLEFDANAGTFAVWAYETQKLPISPLTYPTILGRDHGALERIGDRFLDLPNWRPESHERAHDLEAELAGAARAEPEARAVLEARVASFNRDWRELDRLIAAQFWRVAFFRVAEDEINYRRFFNINDLAGLRMELGPVFFHAHERVFAMLRAGEIEGLRIDHIDGLFDPEAYLTALRQHAGRPFYLVVEKVLAPHESLKADWPIEGGTGYDFVNLALGVLIDPSAEGAFDESYRTFAGVLQNFAAVAIASKLRIMDYEMASELAALGRSAARLASQSAMTADLTRPILERAIRATIANFPVYRTYVDLAGTPDEADLRHIACDCAGAPQRPRSPSVGLRFPRGGADSQRRRAAGEGAQPHRGPALRDADAAGLRADDGEGRRRHRLLSLQPVHRPERGRGSAGTVRDRSVRVSQSQRSARRALASGDAGERDARHQARRGRAGEARRAHRASWGVAPASHIVEPAPARPHRRHRGSGPARSQ